ncbi:MAG: SIS domain-containing protein [Candidatus Aminicenantes bacterium]|nr:SIS domain-containing protein [Candidatus Aminicenantes bacterium]
MKLIDGERITQRSRLLARLNEDPCVAQAIAALYKALREGGKVLVFGNGGSATQASHFAAELVNKFYIRRPALPALALNADTASLTSIANDDDFVRVFARQVEAFGCPQDVALGLTTSGRSANVLQALTKAREIGMATVALAGRWGDGLRAVPVDVLVSVDSDDTPTVQEMHLFVLHAMAGAIEKNLSGGNDA